MVVDSESGESDHSFSMLNLPEEISPAEQQAIVAELLRLSSFGTTGKAALATIVEKVQDQSQAPKVERAVKAAPGVNNTGALQSARVWSNRSEVDARQWDAACSYFGSVKPSEHFLLEMDRGCLQPALFDDAMFGEYVGTIVQSTTGEWAPARHSNSSQYKCLVVRKSPWWDMSCDDDVWLREQATMNRAQNHLVDEQLQAYTAACQTNTLYFADRVAHQVRPAAASDLPDRNRV